MTSLASLAELSGQGAIAVLYLLVALSTAQVAIMIERAVVFARSRGERRRFEKLLAEAVSRRDLGAVAAGFDDNKSMAARVLAAGAARAEDGPEAVDEIMRSRVLAERLDLEKRLAFLGTLGNNAPFIGLFGTVLGIIKAFADLAKSGSGAASKTVMAGISEALVATAVGLLVALPAVVAFNVFQRSIKTRVADSESLAGALLAHLKAKVKG
jgi:biopolymer transport protein ExbB